MNNKFNSALRKSKPLMIVSIAVWILGTLFIVMPVNVAIVESTVDDVFSFGQFVVTLSQIITHVGSNLTRTFSGRSFSHVF